MGAAAEHDLTCDLRHLERLAVAAGSEVPIGRFRLMQHAVTDEYDRVYPLGFGKDTFTEAMDKARPDGQGYYLVERLEADPDCDLRQVYLVSDGEAALLALVRRRRRRQAGLMLEEVVLLPRTTTVAVPQGPRSRLSPLAERRALAA